MSNINDTLKRINELAAKKKSGQKLTPEDLAEKKELYEIFGRKILYRQSDIERLLEENYHPALV